jgi:hypothetical protein
MNNKFIYIYIKKYYYNINMVKKNISNIINFISNSKYDFVNTISDYKKSFKEFSSKIIRYIDIQNLQDIFSIKEGIIVIFYDIIRDFKNHKDLVKIIQFFHDCNLNIVFFVQDEYYDVDFLNSFFRNCKAKIIFTCLTNKNDINRVYSEVPNCKFINVLTGYIPEYFKNYKKNISEKNIDIFYRGRKLHFLYGELGKLKYEIGFKVKEAAIKNNLKEDIEWTDKRRIYSNDWIKTLADSKVTLASPSGSNVVNKNDNIIDIINKYLNINNYGHLLPDNLNVSYDEIFKKFNIKEELNVGQVSPKMFEAVAVGTVLIMYDNCDYNYIFIPNVHYIPLKIDYSNLDEVMQKVKDNNYLQTIADNAYRDIVLSDLYSYKNFIKKIDYDLDNI